MAQTKLTPGYHAAMTLCGVDYTVSPRQDAHHGLRCCHPGWVSSELCHACCCPLCAAAMAQHRAACPNPRRQPRATVSVGTDATYMRHCNRMHLRGMPLGAITRA